MKRIFTAALILLSTAFISLTCNNAYAALCTLTSPLATLNIMDDITLNVIKQREVGKVYGAKPIRCRTSATPATRPPNLHGIQAIREAISVRRLIMSITPKSGDRHSHAMAHADRIFMAAG
jgi:hypothetical protein